MMRVAPVYLEQLSISWQLRGSRTIKIVCTRAMVTIKDILHFAEVRGLGLVQARPDSIGPSRLEL